MTTNTAPVPVTRTNGEPRPPQQHLSRFQRWRYHSAPSQLFTLPVIAILALLLIYPLIQSFFWSFTDFNGYSLKYNFVGFDNYVRVFSENTLLAGLSFTLLFAVTTTLLITAFAIPLALVLNKAFFGRNFVRSVFFFPSVPSIALLGLVWGFVLNPLSSGALNGVLDTLFGMGPFPWLSDGMLAKVSVIIVALWSGVGWHAILYLAYLQSIPADYYEVATVDGASPRQQFFYITLPLLAPAITISTLLLMTGGLKVYELPLVLTNGGPGTATYTITQAIITGGVAQGRYGVSSALGMVFMVAVAIIVLIQLYLSRRVERNIL